MGEVYQCLSNGANCEGVAALGLKAMIIVDDAGRNNASGIHRPNIGCKFRLRVAGEAEVLSDCIVMYG